MKRVVKITTIYNEILIAECYNYESVKKGKENNFNTNKGYIPTEEVKEIAIIN